MAPAFALVSFQGEATTKKTTKLTEETDKEDRNGTRNEPQSIVDSFAEMPRKKAENLESDLL